MDKMHIAIFIIGLWLFFPFPIIFMNYTSYTQLDTSTTLTQNTYENDVTKNIDNNNLIGSLVGLIKTLGRLLGAYIQAMYLIIPGSENLYGGLFSIVILLLQFISGLVVYLLIREG